MKQMIGGRKCFAALLAALLGVNLFLPAMAEEEGRGASTDTTITFEAGTGPTAPVDPENPEIPIDPEEPGVEGSLAIVHITPFSFASGKVTNEESYHDITTAQPNLQVVDLRGTLSGWKLQARLGSFTSLGEESLQGSSIEITTGRLISLSSSEVTPDLSAEVSIPSNQSLTTVWRAPKGKGGGHWINRLYPAVNPDAPEEELPAYVRLKVPGGVAAAGDHTATIVWTLSDTP